MLEISINIAKRIDLAAAGISEFAMERVPATVSAVFFGFVRSAKKNPTPNTFNGETVSTIKSHFGIIPSSPFRGRFFQFRIAKKSNKAPRANLIIEAVREALVSGTILLESETIKTGIATTAIPNAQPVRNAGPFHFAFRENKAKITVIMGTGLIAMPTANGKKSNNVSTIIFKAIIRGVKVKPIPAESFFSVYIVKDCIFAAHQEECGSG